MLAERLAIFSWLLVSFIGLLAQHPLQVADIRALLHLLIQEMTLQFLTLLL